MLLQACGGGGGGGGGGSSMTDCATGEEDVGGTCMAVCMTGEVRDSDDNECRAPEIDAECMRLDAMMPVFVGSACRAECGEGQTRNMTTHECETSMPMPMPVTCTDPAMPLSHGDDCLAECPPAAPVSNNNVCEAADVASECHPTLPVFDRNGSGICEAAQNMSECHATLPVFQNNECVAATEVGQCHATLPVFDRNGSGICEAAQNMSQCHATLPVFQNNECVAASEMSQCHPTLPVFDRNGSGICEAAQNMSECHPTLPVFQNNECVAATEVGQCHPTLPVFNVDDECVAATEVSQCHPTLPVFQNNECVAATEVGQCHPTLPVFNADDECVAATEVGQCHPTLPVFQNNECVAASEMSQCHATLPVFNADDECVAATRVEDCHATLPVFNADDECEAADMASECHATLPFFDPDDSTCKVAGGPSDCPAAEPEFDTGSSGNCRARVATDCSETTPIVINNMCVSFDANTAIIMTQTDAYNNIRNAARNTLNSDSTAQSGNCGPSCTTGQTEDVIELVGASGQGGTTSFRSVSINKDGGEVDYILNEGTNVIPALPTPATDRRFDTDEDLNEWDHRRYELSGGEVDPDNPSSVLSGGSTATADIIVWSDTGQDYYFAGGVWAYDIDSATEVRGAGLINRPVNNDIILGRTEFPDPDDGVPDATYTGHSFGYYAVLPAPADETNRGYFAANMSLTVDFSSVDGGEQRGVSGMINNFLFSTDPGFTVGGKSKLEDALSGLEVTLGAGTIFTFGDAQFTGDTSASILVNGETVNLTGEYGGVFFGDAGAGDFGVRNPPFALGGTWGAQGTTDTAPTTTTEGFGISFIGAFGAKRPTPPPPPP